MTHYHPHPIWSAAFLAALAFGLLALIVAIAPSGRRHQCPDDLLPGTAIYHTPAEKDGATARIVQCYGPDTTVAWYADGWRHIDSIDTASARKKY